MVQQPKLGFSLTMYFQMEIFSPVSQLSLLINAVTDRSLTNGPAFPSRRVTLLSWAVNTAPSCPLCSCLWSLMHHRGELSCQVVPSQLSANGFINHAWLHIGEQPPFGRGLRHLWQRVISPLWGQDRSGKCFMSETRLTEAHRRRLMSPVFNVWRKWNFDRRDEKPFTCQVESAFAGLTAAGRDA